MTLYYEIEKEVLRNGETAFTAYRKDRPWYWPCRVRVTTVNTDGCARDVDSWYGHYTHETEVNAIAACKANAKRRFANAAREHGAETVSKTVVQSLSYTEESVK